ncbi:hypothetical protein BVX93_00590, partial [bacterium B13(2017)]
DIAMMLEAGEFYQNNIKQKMDDIDIKKHLRKGEKVLETGKLFKNKLKREIIKETVIPNIPSKNISFGYSGFTSSRREEVSTTSSQNIPSTPQNPENFYTEPEDDPGELTARINATPRSGNAPLLVNFDGKDSFAPEGNTIESYSWDFDASDGIGENATGQSVSYNYLTSGIYTVTLTIRDNQGNRDSTTTTIDTTGGQHFYVDDNAVDNSGDGTQADPWKNVFYAMSQCDGVTPTTIHIANGTYDATVNGEVWPIVAQENVTLEGESLAATIDGNFAEVNDFFSLTNINSFRVDTITFQQKLPDDIFDLTSSAIVAENCSFISIRRAFNVNTANVTIRNCTFDDSRWVIQELWTTSGNSTFLIEDSDLSNDSKIYIDNENSNVTIR